MNTMILSLAVLVLALGAINALVPTVPLCDFSDCPTVSAIGLGTLHLGADNGISDPDKIHEWITAAVEELLCSILLMCTQSWEENQATPPFFSVKHWPRRRGCEKRSRLWQRRASSSLRPWSRLKRVSMLLGIIFSHE